SGTREILHAIREEVSLPLLDRADCTLLHRAECPPLERVARFLEGMLETVETDPRTRRALTVMQFKCEYADDLVQELDDMNRNNDRLVKALENTYVEARKAETLKPDLTPRIAALDTMAFLAGLVRLSLLDRTRNGMRKNAPALIRAHIASRRASRRSTPWPSSRGWCACRCWTAPATGCARTPRPSSAPTSPRAARPERKSPGLSIPGSPVRRYSTGSLRAPFDRPTQEKRSCDSW
ncbi:MAG TPA: hypothetical protein VLJ84_10260, partial [Usitatibacter sp.]|nr:hypothetical protein [Usitatibacter sp.]